MSSFHCNFTVYICSVGQWKYVTFKPLVFEKFWGPEVVWSSLYQKYWHGIYLLHCVRRSSWTVTTLATLMFILRYQNLRHVEINICKHNHFMDIPVFYKHWYIQNSTLMPNYWNLQNGNELGTFCQQLIFHFDFAEFTW